MRSATLIRLLSVGCFVSTAFTERPMRKVHSHRNHGRNHGRNHSDSRHTRGTARPPKTAAECGALGGRPESFYICDGVSYCCGACTRESPCNFRGIELRGCACSASCSTLARESQAPPFLTEPTKRPALVATNHRHPWTTVIQSKSYEVVSTSKRFQVLYGVVNGVLVHVKSHRDRIDQDVINGRVLPFESMARHALRGLPHCVPDVMFNVNYADDCPCTASPPTLCYSSKGHASMCQAILIPSYQSWNHARWTAQEIVSMQQCYADRYPDATKVDRAVWRGSTTGETQSPQLNTWTDLQRVRLAVLGRAYRDDLDVELTKVVQLTDDQGTAVRRLFGNAGFDGSKRMRPEDYQQYRAVIDVDGNSWSSRFLELLCQNSIVIKQDTPYHEFFSGSVNAGGHYVNVKHDLSDLVQKVRWVKRQAATQEGSARLRKMVQRANQVCRDIMLKDALAMVLLEGWMTLANWTAPDVNIAELATNLKLVPLDPSMPAGVRCPQ